MGRRPGLRSQAAFADAPAEDAQPCTEGDGMKSTHVEGVTSSVILHFLNKSEQELDVLWVSYDGSEISYGILKPGKILAQSEWGKRGAMLLHSVPHIMQLEPFLPSCQHTEEAHQTCI